jgi:hypothetical protein
MLESNTSAYCDRVATENYLMEANKDLVTPTNTIKQLASFKRSLLLKNYLQRIQTLQVNQIGNLFTKVIKTKLRSLALFRQRV